MKKNVQFSKPYGKLFSLKEDFLKNNEKNLKIVTDINKKYIRQKMRKKCKICNSSITKFDFISHKIKYKICNKCHHLNGMHEDTKNFVSWLYKKNSGKNYARNYLKDYNKRVEAIYLPKVQFLKKILKKKKIKIVDIGSGGGHFLKACEIQKIIGYGFEPNKILADLANKKLNNNKVFNVSMKHVYDKIPQIKSDCVSLIGVLEHLQKPQEIFRAFNQSKAKYLYLSVPLFSLTSLLEHISPKVFPRLLSGGHTHLFTKKSLYFLAKKFRLKIIGEWWFGLDFADLYRIIEVSSRSNYNFSKALKNLLFKYIDDLQHVLDKNKVSNEVHMIFKK